GRLEVDPEGQGTLTETVGNLQPAHWSPASPNLYHLALEVRGETEVVRDTVRFGFRSFEARDGRLLLNGKRVFLRGNAITPPDRNIPNHLAQDRTFEEDYIRYLKSVGVNVIRATRHSQVGFDVDDELGMMYCQGSYGAPKDGSPTKPPDDL